MACNPLEAPLTLPVAVVESTGSLTYVTTSGAAEMTIVVTGRSDLRAGEQIALTIAPDRVHLFDGETGRAV
ncbi:hypothetical protein D3C87_2093330 [compost metagenome]